MWLAEDAGKLWTEVFFLAYSPFWMLWALCILVPFRLYEVSNLNPEHHIYLTVCLNDPISCCLSACIDILVQP